MLTLSIGESFDLHSTGFCAETQQCEWVSMEKREWIGWNQKSCANEDLMILKSEQVQFASATNWHAIHAGH